MKTVLVAACGLALLAMSGSANAGVRVQINLGGGGYCPPPRHIYAPPCYPAPRVVYYEPAPVYYYSSQPVVVYPSRAVYPVYATPPGAQCVPGFVAERRSARAYPLYPSRGYYAQR